MLLVINHQEQVISLLIFQIRQVLHAQNGRSSKSFIDEGRWEKVISQVKKGDYVFIQFGHNDEKPDSARHTDPGTTFDANLRRFVNETRAKGGIPVLFNSIVRRNFIRPQDKEMNNDARKEPGKEPVAVEGNTLFDTHGAYLDSPRKVAKELGVAFVDMNKITHVLKNSELPEETREQLNLVKRNTDRMLRLVNQILDFRKIQNKKMKMQVEEIELVSFVRRIMDNFESMRI